MKKSSRPKASNQPSHNSVPQLQTDTLRVSGLNLFIHNLKKLAKLNPDWKLSPEEILFADKTGHKIFQCKFTNAPVMLTPDPHYAEDPNAVAVTVAGFQVGYIDKNASARVRKLLKAGHIQTTVCGIFGGKYKIVDETGRVSVQSSPITIAVKIFYTAERTAMPAVKSSKQTKKAHSKKPFYKRWWFWLIALIFLFGSCNSSNEASPVETEPVEATAAIVQTDNIPEVKSTVPTEAVTTTYPTIETEPSSEATEETSPEAAAIVPTIPEETTLPTEPVETESAETEEQGTHYVLNTNTDVFHYEYCRSVKQMKDQNREDFFGTRDEVLARKFKPCGICHP